MVLLALSTQLYLIYDPWLATAKLVSTKIKYQGKRQNTKFSLSNDLKITVYNNNTRQDNEIH